MRIFEKRILSGMKFPEAEHRALLHLMMKRCFGWQLARFCQLPLKNWHGEFASREWFLVWTRSNETRILLPHGDEPVYVYEHVNLMDLFRLVWFYLRTRRVAHAHREVRELLP